MAKKNAKDDATNLLVGLLVLAIVISVAGIALNLALIKSVDVPVIQVTGQATETGVVNFTQAGAAAVIMLDDGIAFGSGFWNVSCAPNYSILDSQVPYNPSLADNAGGEPRCWINTTAFPIPGTNATADLHVIQNNGSTVLNISAISTKDADDFICGGPLACTTSDLNMSVIALENETGSCISGLESAFQEMTTSTTNLTVALCDRLDFDDNSDELKFFYKLSLPKDTPSGFKSTTIVYEGLAV